MWKRWMTVLALSLVVTMSHAGDWEDAIAAYEKGEYKTAVKWYRKAAEQGFSSAQFNLGLMYDNGQGVPRNNKEAVKWYRKAAEQGFSEAQFNLGNMYSDGRGVSQCTVV